MRKLTAEEVYEVWKRTETDNRFVFADELMDAMLAAAPASPEYSGIRSQDNEKAHKIVDIAPPMLDHASIEGMDDTAGLPPILKKQAS